jgi:hypothetical protein
LGEETVRRVLPRPARATAIPTTFPEHDARRQRPNKPTRGTISGLGMVGVGEEDVSQYRMLSDHSIRGQYYQAGDIASTADVGGTLPDRMGPEQQRGPPRHSGSHRVLDCRFPTSWTRPQSLELRDSCAANHGVDCGGRNSEPHPPIFPEWAGREPTPSPWIFLRGAND